MATVNEKSAATKFYLVTGGGGFVGSAVARRLHDEGHHVRVVDIAPQPSAVYFTEYMQGDLCDFSCCEAVIQGVGTVLHFAANMGGMGTIHEGNDFTIYRDNNSMTLNVLQAAVRGSVDCFLYASSACVYPGHLQNVSDVQLSESDVFSSGEPSPQGLYGLEKLVGELLLRQYAHKLSIRIARLHNVYGPGGSWHDGREKAPGALARKAVAAKKLADASGFEIWGDGSQRRSFIYIDDCVEGLLRLLRSDYAGPVNIGSDHSLSMKELAEVALVAVGLEPSRASFAFDTSKPVGVQARNSDNRLVKDVLGWEPQTSLKDGMQRTVFWIDAQVETLLDSPDDPQSILRQLQKSAVIELGASTLQFGVLLPVTSRGTESPQVCLDHLRKFAASLYSTTWRDTRSGEVKFRVKVYLAVDDDDNFLLEGQKAESVLREEGVWDITRLVCKFPRGHICSLWRHCATAAWKDGCDYMALFGDDVELLDDGWLRGIHQTFQDLSRKTESPHGFGCVAFTDISFPGMPTFPVVHRLHMDIFEGSVIPSSFINQDGDPFLFQLYRRFGSSKMACFRLRNAVGGSNDARYTKEHLKEWTFDVLDSATSTVELWLGSKGHGIGKMLTIDVIVPSFRVQFAALSRILELESSDTCEVMFILIVDDPQASSIAELEAKYSFRPDVRIRVNASNLGASASRNRGMEESAAEYVFFLDDDVVPQPDILIKAEIAIRRNPDCAGLVGTTVFPPADTIFKSAVHLAGVTYFWDIATKLTDDLPWGVTANLIARRNKDKVRYDVRFPKTGGGEDIDFCIRKRNFFVKEGKRGFQAAPEVIATHPWWYNGNRSYWRFYMWAKGDGALVAMFPELCYLDWSPTSAQIFLFTLLSALVATLLGDFSSFKTSMIGFLAVFVANVGHDLYRHLIREKTIDPRSTMTGIPWVIAVVESALIRMLSEGGRLVGQVERGEWLLAVGQQRFDWFAGRVGNGPRDNERRNSRERLVLWLLLLLTISRLT
ncbi:glycosyltransferase family 2 protein [Mycena leptocephala]|nr:glycosyltransferase family 2 protein [Mycena leptocephala]